MGAEEQLAEIQTKLKEAKEVTKDDVEQMVEKLGPKGAAEAFIKARAYFQEHDKDGEAKPMTAAEWRKVLDEDAMDEEAEEEDLMFEGEEEGLLEEAEEELDGRRG